MLITAGLDINPLILFETSPLAFHTSYHICFRLFSSCSSHLFRTISTWFYSKIEPHRPLAVKRCQVFSWCIDQVSHPRQNKTSECELSQITPLSPRKPLTFSLSRMARHITTPEKMDVMANAEKDSEKNLAADYVAGSSEDRHEVIYRLYKRRFAGLIALVNDGCSDAPQGTDPDVFQVFLNIVAAMSWPWFGPISNDSERTYDFDLANSNLVHSGSRLQHNAGPSKLAWKHCRPGVFTHSLSHSLHCREIRAKALCKHTLLNFTRISYWCYQVWTRCSNLDTFCLDPLCRHCGSALWSTRVRSFNDWTGIYIYHSFLVAFGTW